MAGSLKRWLLVFVVFTAAAVFFPAGISWAEQLYCPSNPTAVAFIYKDADINFGGVMKKGNAVGCPTSSWGCAEGICKDLFGTTMIAYTFSLDDLPRFCDLLCTPKCDQAWIYK